jgi:glycosyltransferase involved in cell wall biosynthesis
MSADRQLSVALVASNRYPISQPFAGGLEAHVWYLARALRRRGHRVTLFAAEGSDPNASDATLRAQLFCPSRIARNDSSAAPERFLADHHAYLTLMTDLVAAGSASFDLVHNHSLHYLPVAMAPALGIPMLTTLHTPPTPWLESALGVSMGVGSAFVAVSRHTAQSWRPMVRDVDVIANGIDPNDWPVGTGGTDLAWFGRLTPEKGAHLAIDVARTTGRRLHLAGPVSDRAYFEDCIAARLTDDIVYHGHLDQPALARLVGSCAATLATPLWDEPYGLVVAESLACGTPIAGFRRGGIPEIIDSTCGRLVEPGDVDALAHAVDEAAALDREAVRDRALAHCGLDTMVEAYVQRYHHLIAASSAEHSRRGVA